MSIDEDLALIRLKNKLVARAAQSPDSPNLSFRLRLIEKTRALEAASEKVKEERRLWRQGRIDLVELAKDQDEYLEELDKATLPDAFWRVPEPTYNKLESRRRPPAAPQNSLGY